MSRKTLQNESIRLGLSADENTWSLTDKRADVTWGNAPGEIWLRLREAAGDIALELSSVEEDDQALVARFQGPDGAKAPLSLVFRAVDEALQVYLLPDEGVGLGAVELFGAGLCAMASEDGAAMAPIRMGLWVPAAGDQVFEKTLGTYDYEGVHMAMFGLFKDGAALMATWGDPYAKVILSREMSADKSLVRTRFLLEKSARSLQLSCLGKGDLTTLAKAYIPRAAQLGYRIPWQEKLTERPQARRLFGACNFKLWHALARRIDENRVEQSVTVNWSFDEIGQIAEHLKQDLQLEDVLFHIGGWMTYGYDCKHPDIMPAAPECGGDEGLANCARRVQDCGYLFCLHDNYQDMYLDAPSWDERWIEKNADGSLHVGGVWLGGQAYYTCAREAVALAQRPQNLPQVRKVAHPDAYFIDTTYAVGPQECYDPRHPLTKQEDIYWKAVLSDYARDLFGLFGSECGREWAVPHADFFEGLASVSGRYYHQLNPAELGATVVPFFDMVFHDCIAIHGKYAYKPQEMAEQVIHHVAMGRTLYYHSLGQHLYWQNDPESLQELPPVQEAVDLGVFTRAHNGWAEGMCLWDRYMKNTQEILGPLNKLTSEALIERYDFLDEARLVRRTLFDNGVVTVVNGADRDYVVNDPTWGEIILPPYGLWVLAPTFVAFHARSFNGHTYQAPVLFTLQSLDAQALPSSQSVRVFHGFGEDELIWQGRQVQVQRQAVL